MQLTSNGHVQRSAAQWREIITRYRQSGLAMKEFCAQEGLTFRTFEEWERRQRRAERSKGQFVEVKASSVTASPWAVEVEFPNGARHVGIIYSVLASCRLQGVDPYIYLVDVWQRVDTHPALEGQLLTPRLWKQHFADHPLRSDLDRVRQ